MAGMEGFKFLLSCLKLQAVCDGKLVCLSVKLIMKSFY